MKAKYLTIICTAFALAVTSSVALAQSGTETKTPEIYLSPEGFKILCERFPLNSRCPGGVSLTTPSTGTTTTPETQSSPNPSAPDPGTTDVPPTDTTSPGVPGGAGNTIDNPAMPPDTTSPGGRPGGPGGPGGRPGGTGGRPGGRPGGTGAPGTNTPPTDTTSPGVPGGAGNGTTPEGSPPPTR